MGYVVGLLPVTGVTAAADLRGRHVAGAHPVHRRAARPLRPIGARGHRGAAQPGRAAGWPASSCRCPAAAVDPVRPRRRPEEQARPARPVACARTVVRGPSCAARAGRRRGDRPSRGAAGGDRARGRAAAQPPPAPDRGAASRAARGERRPPVSVVLAGGGTGGHIEPMLALADALRRRSEAGGPADHLPGHRPRHGDPAGARPAATTCG